MKAMSHIFKFKRLIGEVEEAFCAEKKSAQKLAVEESGYKYMRKIPLLYESVSLSGTV